MVLAKQPEALDVPNRRFFENKCGSCAVAGTPCTHAPFGRLFPVWHEWWDARDRGDARFTIAEVARRHRKSSNFVNYAIREANRLPKTRYNVICPTFEEARRIYWDDPTMLRSALPGERDVDYSMNEQRLIVKFPNGSVLQFYGGDDPENLKGIDGEGFIFDEWALCKPECWSLVVQPIVEQYPTRWVVFCYTPRGNNHATQMFDRAACIQEGDVLPETGLATKRMPGWYPVRLVAFRYGEGAAIIPVSGVFTKESLERIRSSPETTKQIFEQEYACARIRDEEMTLITTAMLMDLPVRLSEGAASCPRKRRIIACDPAMGGDACVIYVFNGLEADLPLTLHTRDTMRIYAELVRISNATGIVDFVVDTIGIGKGICDRLKETEEYRVQAFCSSEEGSADTKVANMRAGMWWYVMNEIRNFRALRPVDGETLRQLPFASRYQVRRGGIQIVEKKEIRKLLGCSPDHAEAWAMGLYGLQKAQEYQQRMPILGRRRWRRYRQPEPVNPMDHCG